ncbi:MAG: hypothetical protein JWN08_3018 [Frankiales bacterium]|nr:hypothetical protein [Frankiales bacterium]
MRRLVLSAAVVLLAGCGSDAGLPAETAEALQATVATVVTAVNAGDDDAARTGLTRLREDVAAATRLDRLSDDRGGELLALADEVEAGLSPPAPVEPEPAASPAASPPAPVEPESDDEQKDRGKGDKGEDREEDD